MLKFWARILEGNKILKQCTVDIPEGMTPEEVLNTSLEKVCYELDLAHPIIQKKHIRDIEMYNLTRFLPSSFMEEVMFDRMDVSIFDDSRLKKNKN